MFRGIIQILFFFTVSLHLSGQQCTGTLGNAVVNIDFGSGDNPGPSISQVPSAYHYSSQDCPAEGFYTLRSSTNFCFNSAWHIVPSDHTHKNPNGYFLMVNALPGTSDVYIDTIKGLCANTTFEISSWILNLRNPFSCPVNDPDPQVTLTVTDLTGSVLAQFNTNNILVTSAFIWNQYRFQFKSPLSGDIIFKITATGTACNSDLAFDDITFRPCAGNIRAGLLNSSASQLDVCLNSQTSYVLTATYGNINNPAVQWQVSSDGNSWTNIAGAIGTSYTRTPTSIGNYYYRFFVAESGNTNCGYYSNPVNIEVQSLFAQATNYVFGCYGSTIEFYAAGGDSYAWTGPSGFASNLQGPSIPNVGFNNTGMYVVKVMTQSGCYAYDTTNLVIYEAPIASASPLQSFLCEGDSVQLFANGSVKYRWLPTAGLSNDTVANPFAAPKETTTYTVRVYNKYTCFDTASVNIVVWKRPVANAGPDKFTIKNRPVLLEGKVSGSNVTYAWSPATYLDNSSIQRPKASPPAEIIYTLTVTSNNGCGVVTDDVKVEVIDKLYIPSAFTPNRDGLNDIWEIITFDEYPNATVQVFNRWGQTVYSGKGLHYKPWDGTYNGQPVETGTYVYIIDLHNNKKILKGTVTVIR